MAKIFFTAKISRSTVYACPYNNGQQEAMRFMKSMRLIERAWALKARPSISCVTHEQGTCQDRLKIMMEKYTLESVIRGHHIYKSIWQPILGEQLTLERKEGNSHDRHAVTLSGWQKMVAYLATYHESSHMHTGTLSDVVEWFRVRGLAAENVVLDRKFLVCT